MISSPGDTPTSLAERWQDGLAPYLQSLEAAGQTGRYRPCVRGATAQGQQVALGFSCFALKLYYMLGLWEELAAHERQSWVQFIKSFQVQGSPGYGRVGYNAWLDPAVMTFASSQLPRWRQVLHRMFPPKRLTYPQQVLIAETKQAIASLAQVGETSPIPYRGFPMTPVQVRTHLQRLDWTQPWGAGGQAAAIAVFLQTQAPRLLEPEQLQQLLRVATQVFTDLADPQTGAYFLGPPPEHGELVNGAMKVLTALDWLNTPVHYPERLIDTCLAHLPSPEGCHLVDAVYVLYRCSRQTEYQRSSMQTYCDEVLTMIEGHRNPDGGFSYHVGRSQTHYYGVPITLGLPESDIHGTCLLTWAVAMILDILESNQSGWQVIRP